MARHPIQPLYEDEGGRPRFRENAIVRFLLDRGKFDMNDIAAMEFSDDDREQFAQLIGYSLSGFGELSYVSNETYEAAHTMLRDGVSDASARVTALNEIIAQAQDGLRIAATALFRIHPDDLVSATVPALTESE